MTVVIPEAVRAELLRRTKPVDDRRDRELTDRAVAEAVAEVTSRLVDLLGQHLADGEELRDIHSSSGHKVGLRGVKARVGFLVLTDRRILCVIEDQAQEIAPMVQPFDYGTVPIRGKRMHLGGPSVVVESGAVVVTTRNGKVDEVTARLSSPPPQADWLAAVEASGAAAPVAPAAWHPDPTGRHEHRWWDGTRWTDQVADAGVASTDPVA